jgi:hypothetical protein
MKPRWFYLASLGLALVGVLIAVVGARLVFQGQAEMQGSRMWPLPGMVLVDWAGLGVLGFLDALLHPRGQSSAWLKALWFVPGALLPMAIVGGFSIGLFVLLSFFSFLASAVMLTIPEKGDPDHRSRWRGLG